MPEVKNCVDFLDVLREVERNTKLDTEEFKDWCTMDSYNTSFFSLGAKDPAGYLDVDDPNMDEFSAIYDYIATHYGSDIILLWDY